MNMTPDPTKAALYKKIFTVQQALDPIIKDQENPYYSSSYFDVNKVIDVLLPLLAKEKLLVLQPLTSVENLPALLTVIVDTDTGESFAEAPVVLNFNTDAQKFGGAVTYFRRYALVSMFLIRGEQDDDGNMASGIQPAQKFTQHKKKAVEVITETIEDPFVDEPKGTPCPKCLVGTVVDRKGKYGSFRSCNQFPRCKYSEK